LASLDFVSVDDDVGDDVEGHGDNDVQHKQHIEIIKPRREPEMIS